MLDSIIGGIGKAADFVGGIFSSNVQRDVAMKNLDFMKKDLAWRKSMQAESWLRDDTAVQRRMKDLEAAGINPLMAAGSAAGNAPVVSTSAPQLDPKAVAEASPGANVSRAGRAAIDAISMSKDFAIKDGQAQLLQAQTNKTNTEADAISKTLPGNLKLQEGNMKLQDADLVLKRSQAESLKFDIEKLKPAEVRVKTQQIQNMLQEIKASNFNISNQKLLTDLKRASDRNEQVLRQAGLSESNARLAAMAVELEMLKANKDILLKTKGAKQAGAYTDLISKMDMVKMFGASIGDKQLFDRISRLLRE